jgi:hypothetical protein
MFLLWFSVDHEGEKNHDDNDDDDKRENNHCSCGLSFTMAEAIGCAGNAPDFSLLWLSNGKKDSFLLSTTIGNK